MDIHWAEVCNSLPLIGIKYFGWWQLFRLMYFIYSLEDSYHLLATFIFVMICLAPSFSFNISNVCILWDLFTFYFSYPSTWSIIECMSMIQLLFQIFLYFLDCVSDLITLSFNKLSAIRGIKWGWILSSCWSSSSSGIEVFLSSSR